MDELIRQRCAESDALFPRYQNTLVTAYIGSAHRNHVNDAVKYAKRMRILPFLTWTSTLAQLVFNLLHIEHDELCSLVL